MAASLPSSADTTAPSAWSADGHSPGGKTVHHHGQQLSATRCLHVGNVPANLTEAQLTREFEKFGPLEGLKLITQRNGNRRFAFITFRQVEHAVAARHAMSKLHPWKR
jgi:RNA recognition motif-containing protein